MIIRYPVASALAFSMLVAGVALGFLGASAALWVPIVLVATAIGFVVGVLSYVDRRAERDR